MWLVRKQRASVTICTTSAGCSSCPLPGPPGAAEATQVDTGSQRRRAVMGAPDLLGAAYKPAPPTSREPSPGRVADVSNFTALECPRGRDVSTSLQTETLFLPSQGCLLREHSWTKLSILRRYAETSGPWRMISQQHIFISPFKPYPQTGVCLPKDSVLKFQAVKQITCVFSESSPYVTFRKATQT